MTAPLYDGHGGTGRGYACGCRCDRCRDAHSTRIRRRRMERKAARRLVSGRYVADVAQEKHGLTSTYINWYCRCLSCTSAWRERARRLRGTS
jgi:hypothetical protein